MYISILTYRHFSATNTDYTETYNMDMVWISKSFVLFEFNPKREHERFYRLSCITNQKRKVLHIGYDVLHAMLLFVFLLT